MTLEAAVILPVLACLFAFFLFFFRILQVQLVVQNALERTGRTLAIYAVVEADNIAAAKTLFLANLDQDAVINQYVSGAGIGIGLWESSFEGDYIFLKANYQMKFPVKLLGKRSFTLSQQTRWRKWTGWHKNEVGETENVVVYITETGKVYHQTQQCPYLELSIKSINVDEVEGIRNESGEKYKLCNQCAEKNEEKERIYITNYGNRYHYDLNCSGIKRTILQKYLSEVREMGACSKCWN